MSRLGSRNFSRDFSSSLSRGGMGGDEPTLTRDFIKPGDVEGLVRWLDNPKNHKDAADAVSFSPEPDQENAFVDFISSSPEFRAWDKEQVAQAVNQANELDLMERFDIHFENLLKTEEDQEKKNDSLLEKTIKSAVAKAIQEALDTKPVKKVKITKTQLAEGIRTAIRKSLKESMENKSPKNKK